MKQYLLAALLLPTLPAVAQLPAPTPVAQPAHYQYGMLSQAGNRWYLDYGQGGSDFTQRTNKPVVDASLQQDNETIRKMESVVSVLNYLDSRGWEFVNSTSYSGTTYSGRTDYLLRRRMQ